MERYSYRFLGLLLVLLVLPLSLRAQDTSRKELIQDRLLSDISSINDQLSQLNRTVNQLEDRISELRNTNQQQRNRINQLEETVETLRNGSSTVSTSDEESVSDEESAERQDTTVSGNDSPAESTPSMWESHPQVSYEIRREPLNYELIYITTDDTTLTKLAHRYYRDAGLWRNIYRMNEEKLPSPDVVPPEVRLQLPPIDELETQ